MKRSAPLLLVALLGCDDGASGGDARKRDAAVANTCRLNSDCPPGWFCNNTICTFDCRNERDCAEGERCDNGQCVDDAPDMAFAPDMAPPRDAAPPRPDMRPPEPDAAPPEPDAAPDAAFDCRRDGCPEPLVCDTDSGDCERPPRDCRRDGCPVGEVCDDDTGECAEPPPDCNRDGCGVGERCDARSGRCVPQMELGAECQRAADCPSGICLDVTVAGQRHVVCSQLCCSERDCPFGYGCVYNNGVQVCLPAAIYPPNFTYERAAGARCDEGAGVCQSGICEGRDQGDRCVGRCCTDQDCGGRACHWTISGFGAQQLAMCDIPLGAGRTGSGCTGQPFECWSNICVANPRGQEPGQPPGLCADFCCSNQDCPNGTSCGQVLSAVNGNVVTACTPATPGPKPAGDPCASEDECASFQCVEGTCHEPCCDDATCPAGQQCLLRVSDEGVFIRVCAVVGE